MQHESQTPEEGEKAEARRRERRRERLLRRAVPVLLVAPWFLGLLWTASHPLVSVITGELKCRGQYIDENAVDVHRHRVEAYPTTRASSSSKKSRRVGGGSASGGMCDAVRSATPPVSPSVECLRHQATETVAFDVVRILPSLGPVIDSAEAVVLVVGDERVAPRGGSGDARQKKRRGDWYERSDMNASVLHLIKKLGSARDSPWLNKAVFVVSPASAATTAEIRGDATPPPADDGEMSGSPPSLGSVVDAFVASYLGDEAVRPLPPDFTFPMIRSVLVLSDVVGTTAPSAGGRTEVRVLPQGTGGSLPNLDLVFAAVMSLQSHPAGGRLERSRSLYHGDSELRMHPFGDALEERAGKAMDRAAEFVGWKGSAAGRYARDLAGLFGFVAALAIGPRQPHASALDRGIDALTIELRVPADADARAAGVRPIHPHRADLVRCVEHLLRSVSNLHERLNHSVAQYAMPSPSKFVSHGEYVYPAILVASPMVARAAALALRDLGRFRFAYAGGVVGAVCAGTSVVGALAASFPNRFPGWISYAAFCFSYLLVAAAARRRDRRSAHEKGAGADEQLTMEQTRSNDDSHDACRRGSLRFIACLLGIYLHAPLLLANYPLGLPSAAFWSPLLAMLALPPSLRKMLSGSRALSVVVTAAACAFLLATSPPVLLVPRIFGTYTPYVLCVYTPLHLFLAALWLA